MKLIIFLVFTAVAGFGWAQAPAKPEAEPAKEAAPKPAAEAPKQAAAGPRIPKVRRWTEDARHCLERPTPDEVIKCAEEYL